MFETLREDYLRYRKAAAAVSNSLIWLRTILSYGFIAVAVYRYGRWARTIQPKFLSIPFKVLYIILKVPVELTLGIDISVNGNIGPGFYIGHFGCIFIHCDAGRNFTVGQGVTLGFKGAGRSDYWPTVGNDVYIGTGAKVIGNVKVGDGVIIGANTVVTKDVPPRTRVVGAAVRMTPLDISDQS